MKKLFSAMLIALSVQVQAQPCSLPGSLNVGLLAFYPFGSGSLADASGSGNNLTNTTSAFPVMDRFSNPACAYHFNRSSGDFLQIPAASSTFLNGITTSAFSVSLWYQPTGPRADGAYELLLGRNNTPLHCPDTYGEWSIGLYDCRKAVVAFDQYSHWQPSGGYPTCAAELVAISNRWHHLAFVYDGISTYELYIDGVLSLSSSGPCGSMAANIGQMLIGQNYTGDIDDILIYNRALTATEVSTLYRISGFCCTGGTPPPLPC
ncbi:MAG TPA: LamG domain-containing protein, partial [Chitinophagaceae bacterium]|nr:LamG domain-containing protein [Chitinophagaceae bacterium]